MIRVKNPHPLTRMALGVTLVGGVLVTGAGLAAPVMASTSDCGPCALGTSATGHAASGYRQVAGGAVSSGPMCECGQAHMVKPLGTKPVAPKTSAVTRTSSVPVCVCDHAGPGAGHATGNGTGMGAGGGSSMGTLPGRGSASGFGQVAAAPTEVNAPIDQLIGSVGAPLINVNIPCAAPWNQGGLLGARYNACNAAPVYQQNGPKGLHPAGAAGYGHASGFGQVAAAPTQVNAPIDQLIGSVGAPLINVNIPCAAPWQQGGLLGAKYNACNAAPVHQEN